MERVRIALVAACVAATLGGSGCFSSGSGSSRDPARPGPQETWTPSTRPTPSAGADGGTSGIPPVTTYACSASDSCQYWFCDCQDGSVVNSSFCDNGYCMTAAAVCPDACATFRHGAWTGYAGGGPGSNASNPGRSDAGVVDPVDPVDPVDAGGLSEWPECGGLVDDSDGCGECLIDSCCWELETCAADVDCTGLFECIQSCTSDACIQGCADTYSWGVSDLRSIADCMNSYCEFACG